jgi:hypothetical protein
MIKRTIFVAVSLLSTACVDNLPETVDSDEPALSDIEQDVVVNCGARYTPALRKYELAVIAAKLVNNGRSCNEAVNPRNGERLEASFEAVGDLMQQSISICSDFRRVYNESPFAQPARLALSKSLLSEVVSGRLNTTTFATIERALIGKRMYGPKPGVANTFIVTFLANGQLEYLSYDGTNGTYVRNEDVSWSVRMVAGKPKIKIDIVDGSTLYTPTYGGLNVTLEPTTPGVGRISTSSDPCSA